MNHARRTITLARPSRRASAFGCGARCRSPWSCVAGGRWYSPRARIANSRSRPWCATAWRSTPSSTATPVAAVAAFMAVYIAVVALSIPGALFLTISGGILFGTLVGGAAARRRRHHRRDHHLPGGARAPAARDLMRRAGPLAVQARRRLPRRRVQLSAVPAPGAGVSVLPGQSRAGAGRREARDLRGRDRDRHHPGDLRVRVLRRRARQRDRRAGESPIAPASPPAAPIARSTSISAR